MEKEKIIDEINELLNTLVEDHDKFMVFVAVPHDDGARVYRQALSFPYRLFGETVAIIARDLTDELLKVAEKNKVPQRLPIATQLLQKGISAEVIEAQPIDALSPPADADSVEPSEGAE